MRTRSVWPFVGVSAVCVVVAATGAWLAATRLPSLRAARVPPTEPAQLASQHSPEYLAAKRLYAEKDYQGALATVNRLLASRAWSEREKAFLLRQRAICERALGIQPAEKPSKRIEPKPEDADCGPRALARIARKLGTQAGVAELRRLAGTTGYGTNLEGLKKAAEAQGLKAEGLQVDRDALGNLDSPAILWVDGSHYLYDDNHNVIQVTDRRSNVWTYEFDDLGNCTYECPPGTPYRETTYTYGDYSRMTSRTDPMRHYTLWEYDDCGNLTNVYWKTSEQGSTLFRVQYAYPDPNYGLAESKTEYKRGDTFVTEYDHDTDGNLTGMTTPNGRPWAWAYNEYGVRTSQIAPNDEAVTYTLDEWDRVVEKALDTGGTYTYTFDGNGNLTQMTGNSSTWSWTYDENNRKLTETKGNRSITYVYDETGKKGLLCRVYDWASTGNTYAGYSYTARNQVALVADAADDEEEEPPGGDGLDSPGGGPPGGASYQYDNNGNVTRIVRGNGTKTLFTYDEANRVVSIVHRKSDDTLIASCEYEYTDDDLVETITEDNEDVQTFVYDEMDRLVAASRTGSLGTYSEEYELDGAGNRLQKIVGQTTYDYVYSDDDELLEEWIGENLQREWEYDLNGNQTSRTVGQTTHTFSYNSENRLTQISQGMNSIGFAYDGLGRRISRAVSSGMSATTTYFHFDGDRIINEQVGSSAISVTYRYGNGMVRRNAEWPLFDAQGNTRKVTADNQAVSGTFVYDAFGHTTYSSGSASLMNRYCGNWGYRDDGDTFASLSASAGLLHVGARYYEPWTGRFTTRDTLLTEHPYVYCDGDPVNLVDGDGRLPLLLLAVAAVAVAAFAGGCSKQSKEKAKTVGGAAAGAGATPGLGEVVGVLEATPDAVTIIKNKVPRTQGGIDDDFSREYPKYADEYPDYQR